jgi:hypothetical protein
VRSAHQCTHHLVADAEWSDQGLLAAVSAQVLPALLKKDASCQWINDDAGFAKKGRHSVGVGRQYRPAPMPAASPRGSRPRTRLVIDETHTPLTVIELAQASPARRWRQVTWRVGTNSPLRSRFAAL